MIIYKKIAGLFVVLLILISYCWANSIDDIYNLKFKHLTIKSGLSNNDINTINQDSVGFIWIGTEDGLNRFDGNKVVSYYSNSKDSTSISNNTIYKIYVSKKGDIWLGTFGGGLNRYDPEYDVFEKFVNKPEDSLSIPSDYITDITEDKEGNLWIATDGGGVAKFDVNRKIFNQITDNPNNPKNSLSYGDVECLKFLNDSILIVGTAVGLDLLNINNGNISNYFTDSVYDITSINTDIHNNLWISTFSKGLFKLNFSMNIIKNYTTQNSRLGENIILSTLYDKDNRYWVGTESEGLYLYEEQTDDFINFSYNIADPFSLSHNSIDCIYFDEEGSIWVGTYSGGVNYAQVTGLKFQHFYANNSINGLNNNIVTSFCETRDSKIWIGTDGGGINIFDPLDGSFKYLTNDINSEYQLSSNYVLDLFLDSKNRMWVSTYNGGITRIDFDNHKIVYFKNSANDKNSIPTNHIRQVLESNSGEIWIASTSSGLLKFDESTNKFLNYSSINSFSNISTYNYVTNIYEDTYNNLWISSYAGGLYQYNKKLEKFINFSYDEKDSTSISSNFINDMVEDNNGTLWIATRNGLNRYIQLEQKFERIELEKKGPENSIKSLLSDNNGNLWLGTNKNLFKINYSSWKIIKYDDSDNLQSNQFSIKARLMDKNGILYFGGINGFNRFDPAKIEFNQFIPSIVITEFKIFHLPIDYKNNLNILDRTINYAEVIKLDYKDYMISFSFASLSYFNNQKNKYIYKLIGFDDRWNYLKTENTAIYTNIPPGKYTLQIKGSNNDVYWNKVGKSINIVVKPPYWNTIWFKILVTFSVTLIIGLFLWSKFYTAKERNRILQTMNTELTRQIKKRKEAELSMQEAMNKANEANRLKSEFLANISHEIRTPLNSVIGFSELLKQMSLDKTQNQYIKSIKSAGNTLLHLINDILDLSKMEAGKMKIEKGPVDPKSIIQEIQLMFQMKIESKGLKFLIEIDENLPGYIISDETRIRQILINLIGNALKFTDKGFIKIKIEMANISEIFFDLIIYVIDSGRGIEADQLEIIFKSFQQNNYQRQNEYGGTGLGLAITEKLVTMLNGEISVKSELNNGSVFCVKFKNVEISKINNIYRNERFYNTKKIHFPGKTILVVEDIESNIIIINNLLKKLNVNVMTAENGEETLVLLKNSTPDLILMDIRMPVLDGFITSEYIKSDERLKQIPIIALTASADLYSKDQLDSVFVDIINKPIDNSKLINILSKYLSYEQIEENIEEHSANKNEKSCSIDNIIKDKRLLQYLKTDVIERIPDLLGNMLIDDITKFVDDVMEIAKEYNNECLIENAEYLMEQIEFFNIRDIQTNLEKFYTKIKEVQ